MHNLQMTVSYRLSYSFMLF